MEAPISLSGSTRTCLRSDPLCLTGGSRCLGGPTYSPRLPANLTGPPINFERGPLLTSWYEENRGKALDYAKDYREENHELVLERTRKWKAANKEKVAAYNREYRQKNRKQVQSYQREYRRENPDFHRAANHRRRSKQKEAFVENVQHTVVFDRDNWICQGCGIECPKEANYPAKDSATLDHIIPLSKGGEHSYANTQLLCLSCNSTKGNRELERLANV